MKDRHHQYLYSRPVLLLWCILMLSSISAEAQPSAPSESFVAKFETTQGKFKIEAKRAWAPIGYERLYALIQSGFYTDMAIYRILPGTIVQFGIHTERAINDEWNEQIIVDDPTTESNEPWTISFASSGEDSRGTELFINLKDNTELDEKGFAVVAKVTSGLEIIESFYGDYGDEIREDMNGIIQAGNLFLRARYPKLDYIKTATIIKEK